MYTSEEREKVYPISTADGGYCSEIKSEVFTPYDNREYDNLNKSERNSIIMWAHNKNNEPCCLHIMQFSPFVRMILPDSDIYGNHIIWDDGAYFKLINQIEKYIKLPCFSKGKEYILSGPMSYYVSYHPSLYNYGAKEERVLTMRFKNAESARIAKIFGRKKKEFNKQEIQFTPIENTIDNVRRLKTMSNTKYSQWFSVECRELLNGHPEKISTIKEYCIDYSTIIPIDETESVDWITKPTMLIMDLETYSSNPKKFTNAENPEDVIYMNSVVYGKLGEIPRKICLTTAKSEATDKGEVILLKTEEELICKTFEIIKELDPDLVGGYNVYGFDFPYIMQRVSILGMETSPRWKLASRCGRIRGKELEIYDKTWESSGYGNNRIYYPIMDGRVVFDLLPNIRKSFKLKLYNLDFVSNHFLDVGKNPLEAWQMFKAFDQVRDEIPEGLKNMREVIEYCIVDSIRPFEIFEKISLWYNWKELSNVAGINTIDIFTRGEQKRCFSQICDESYKDSYYVPDKIKFEGKYKGATVQEPIRGKHKNLITLDFSSLYPSIMQALNICYTTFIKKEDWYKYKDHEVNIIKFTQEEPEVGDFENSDNEDDNENENDEDEDKPKKKAVKKEVKMINVDYEYRFIKSEIKEGIIPKIERRCVSDRKKVKKLLAEVEDLIDELEAEMKLLHESSERYKEIYKMLPDLRIKCATLDKRQNSIKIFANSLYGFLGAIDMGLLPHLPSALCITAMGREYIEIANNFIREKYNGKVIYGDTDSGMYEIPGVNTRKEAYEMGLKIAPEVSALFPPPLKMEFEKAADMLILKKKNYYMMMFNADGTPKTKNGKISLTAKGVATARRDKSNLLTTLYQQIVDCIMIEGDIFKSLEHVFNTCSSLLLEEIKVSSLTVIRELKKIETGPLKELYKHMKENGREPQKGERIEYIMVNNGDSGSNVGEKMREYEMWLKDPNREDVDMHYYISSLSKSIDYLFNTGYLEHIDFFETITYQPISRRKDERNMKTGIIHIFSEIVRDILYEDKEKIVRKFGIDFVNPGYTFTRNEYAAFIIKLKYEDICDTIRDYLK